MKSFILWTVIFLSPLVVLSQVVAIQNDRDRDLFLCLDNRLTVAVEKIASKDILLSTDNGSIKPDKYGDVGQYIYHAKTPGRAMIYVKKRNKRGTESIIDSVEFYVRRMPDPTPRFAGKSRGSLSQEILMAHLGVIVYYECEEHYPRFPVNSYSIAVYRGGKEIFRRQIKGATIDKESADFFRSFKNGDLLKFEDIKISDCDGELRSTEQIEITVTDAGVFEYQKLKSTDTTYLENPVTGELIQKITDSAWIRIDK